MRYKEFKDNIKLSRLGMGNMRLPVKEIEGKQVINYEKGQEIIDCCYNKGINYYDTAYIYHDGDSEVFIGKALSKYPRDSYYIADKYNIVAKPDYKLQFSEQLERLGVDYIDFYLLHAIDDENVEGYLNNGCIDYFIGLKQEGKIKYLGFSFHGNPPLLEKLVSEYDWDFVQIQLNYYDWYYGSADKQYEILSSRNIPVMVMEPVHGGMLVNLDDNSKNILKSLDESKSFASWAFRFVMSLDSVQVVLSGMSTLEQVIDNVNTFSNSELLSKSEHEAIKTCAKNIRERIGVMCTSCRYCVPHCPVGLDIPYLLYMYNEYKASGYWRLSILGALPSEKMPGSCIGCGACTKNCPQQIKVSMYMQEIQDEYIKLISEE